jgi:hypothetical protein
VIKEKDDELFKLSPDKIARNRKMRKKFEDYRRKKF